MIAFGTAIADQARYEEIALPGIERLAEPDSLILTRVGYDSIQQPYNEMMDEAAAQPGLEALILLHEDLELTDRDLLSSIRRTFEDPRVGLFGLFGARGVKPHLIPSSEHLYGQMTLRVVDQPDTVIEEYLSKGPFEVEGVDGVMLAIAPWVVRSIRFGEALVECFHGYDADLALRIRSVGGRVVCDNVEHVHYMRMGLWKDSDETFRRSADLLSRAWDRERQPREWAPSFHC